MVDTVSSAKLLTPSELLTQSGAVTSVFFVTQGLRHALGMNPRYVALVLSLLLAFLGASFGGDYTLLAWLVAVPNAFIIYAASVGFASMTGQRRRSKPAGGNTPTEVEETGGGSRFWTSWF